MTKRQFVTICFRMFAVYLALGALTNIPYILGAGSFMFSKGSAVVNIFLEIVLIGVSFFMPWLFWKKSDYLMLKVFGDKDFFVDAEGESIADEETDKSVKFSFSRDEVLEIGITLIGCWIIADSLPSSLNVIVRLFSTDTLDSIMYADKSLLKILRDIVQYIGSLVLGYLLIRKTGTIIKSINKMRAENT